MTCTSSATMIALVAAGVLAATGCGGADKPAGARAPSETGGPTPITATTPTPASARGTSVDRAFVAAMAPRHRSAITIARIARRQATSKFAKRLARDIVTSQGREISAMRRADKALELAGVKTGSLGPPTLTNADARKLMTARPFEPAFLSMMIARHQEAIEIARAEIARGRDTELRALAAKIVKAYTREMREMREQLAKPQVRPARPVSPVERDPRSGSPDMPGVDDTTGTPTQTR